MFWHLKASDIWRYSVLINLHSNNDRTQPFDTDVKEIRRRCGFRSVVLECCPRTSSMGGNLSEMHILGPTPKPLSQKLWAGPSIWVWTSPPGDSEACWRLNTPTLGKQHETGLCQGYRDTDVAHDISSQTGSCIWQREHVVVIEKYKWGCYLIIAL